MGSGTLGLAMSIWQYLYLQKYLWGPDYKSIAGMQATAMQTPAIVISVLLFFIGLFAFLAVLLRMS